MERILKIFEHKNNLIDYYQCVERYFTMYSDKENLQKLIDKRDVDIACAFEHQQMKKHILEEDGLKYQNYYPEHFRKMKIPSLD